MLFLLFLLGLGLLFVWAYRHTLSEDVMLMEFWRDSMYDGDDRH